MNTYLINYWGDFFKFGMLGRVSGGHKICELEIRGVKKGKLVVPVNNTFVCHMAFLAADTRPCVLMVHNQYAKVLSANKFYPN